MTYFYGMRLRPYSIGCQPMKNLINAAEDPSDRYYNILEYSEPLSAEDIRHYSLDDLHPKADLKAALIRLYKPLNHDFLKALQNYTKKQSGDNYNLIRLIEAYSKNKEATPDFLADLDRLDNDDSISCMQEYYELIDLMIEEVSA